MIESTEQLTAQYYGKDTTRSQVFTVLRVERGVVEVAAYTDEGAMCISEGSFTLRDGWGVANLCRWRMSHEDWQRLRTRSGLATAAADELRWERESERMYTPRKQPQRTKPRVDPRQLHLELRDPATIPWHCECRELNRASSVVCEGCGKKRTECEVWYERE